MINNLLKDILLFDLNTYNHCVNVGLLAQKFSKYINRYFLFNIDTDIIKLCGELHDIGKIKLNKNILNKDSKLSSEEFSHIKTHPELGAAYVNALNVTLPEEVRFCILYHHKGIKNTGYPSVKEDIPTNFLDYINIITICDIYDALTMKRAYKDAFLSKNALDIMDKLDTINPQLYSFFKEFLNVEVLKRIS